MRRFFGSVAIVIGGAALLWVLLVAGRSDGHNDRFAEVDYDQPELAAEAAAWFQVVDDAHGRGRDLTGQEIFKARTWLSSIHQMSRRDYELVAASRDVLQAYTALTNYRKSSQRDYYERDYQKAREVYLHLVTEQERGSKSSSSSTFSPP